MVATDDRQTWLRGGAATLQHGTSVKVVVTISITTAQKGVMAFRVARGSQHLLEL